MREDFMTRNLVRPEDRREYTPDQKSKAYLHWRKSGSMKRTAHALGIPEGTIISWSRAQGWMLMKHKDDARDREVIVANARMRLVDEADGLVDRLIEMTKTGENAESVKLRALIKGLELIGMDEKKNQGSVPIQRREPMASPLSSPEKDALSKFLLNIIEEGPGNVVGHEGSESRTDESLRERGPEREQGGERHPLYAFAIGDSSELPGRTGSTQEPRESPQGTGTPPDGEGASGEGESPE
jgi:hypothetical protein